jgi:protein involved in polysaccharide export with SLBB domain
MKKIYTYQPVINFFLVILLLNIGNADAQSTNLSEEFLEGLPPSVREQIEVQNKLEEDARLEDLFRADTSLEKNKYILENIKRQLSAVESQLSGEDQTRSRSQGGLTRFGDIFFKSLQSSFMPINVPNLDEDYIVNVGDKFNLLLTGKISDQLEVEVSRDGSLIIPEFGKVFIAQKTLADAELLVSNFIANQTVGVSSYLGLSEVRDIQVLILGGIESPGIFTLGGGSSILSAINVAGGISDNGSYRKIDLKRKGETLETIDLYDIFVFGNFKTKNKLRSGDTIYIHPKSFLVPVSGGVNFEAIFEILPGESSADAIDFAGGFSSGFTGFKDISLTRVDLESSRIDDINIEELSKTLLRPRDSILVPSYTNSVKPMKKVSIEGMVNRPGEYFISEGETLSKLISRAGGYKDNAYSYGGALFRESAKEKEKIYAQLNYADTVNYIVSNIGKPNRSVNSSALDLLSEELRAQNHTGRVVADFGITNIKSKNVDDIELEDNDRIVIPSLEKIVYLFGDFKNPSNLTYKSNLTIQDYIDSVGGVKDSAFDEIIVIDPDGLTHIYKKSRLSFSASVDIYPGSIIYAPRDIGKLSGVMYASTVSPILSSLALSLASLNSISD